MLEHALEAMRARGAVVAEGYPVRLRTPETKMPAAFAWTGTPSLFAKQGFVVIGNADGAKQRVRRQP
jgi:hypothetical protein